LQSEQRVDATNGPKRSHWRGRFRGISLGNRKATGGIAARR